MTFNITVVGINWDDEYEEATAAEEAAKWERWAKACRQKAEEEAKEEARLDLYGRCRLLDLQLSRRAPSPEKTGQARRLSLLFEAFENYGDLNPEQIQVLRELEGDPGW